MSLDWGEHWQDAVLAGAQNALPPHVLRFVTAGALDETTTAEAPTTWGKVRLRPRMLVDVREPATATSLLGQALSWPVGIAPTSMQRWVHPDGELAMARAAADADTLLVVSSNAGTPFADIGATGVHWWLQAYVTADRSLIEPTYRRAVDAGARGVVLTLDTPFPGPKFDIDDAAFGDLAGVYGVNHPDVVRDETPGASHARDLGPDDIAWLGEVTGLPVVVKGVLRGDDAVRCLDAGAAGVWVSNHGGRQLDRAVSSARALPEVSASVRAHRPGAPVIVDGGLRSGLDVLTALALGADAAFVGRLPLLALHAGSDGVRCVVEHLRRELSQALALAGCPRLVDARALV